MLFPLCLLALFVITPSLAETDLAEKLANVEAEVANLKSEMQSLRVRNKRHSRRATIGFTAYAQEPYTTSVAKIPIMFPKIIFAQPRNSYDASKSTFTCPRSGVYLFTFCLHGGNIKNNQRTTGVLVHEGKPIVATLGANMGTSGIYQQGCNSALIAAIARDRVWVAVDIAPVRIWGSELNRRTTFTGLFVGPITR